MQDYELLFRKFKKKKRENKYSQICLTLPMREHLYAQILIDLQYFAVSAVIRQLLSFVYFFHNLAKLFHLWYLM